MALTDALTGISNRRHAMIFLEAVWTATPRGRPLSIVLFDLDHFSRVNETHGHVAGDQVLGTLGEVLATTTRSVDLSARLGGEEFVSILVDCDVESAVAFAEDVRDRLARSASRWGPVTASAGVAVFEVGMGAPDLLVAAADRALHAAKRAGRDQVRRFDELADAAELGTIAPPTARRVQGTSDDTRDAVTALLVDDDPAALHSTRRAIENLGHRVEAFTDPFAAVERVRTAEVVPHVLVTDVVMPHMSGFALVDMLAPFVEGLPVLYLSGYEQHESHWSGAPGARSALLGKPFTTEDLDRELRRLLDPPATSPGTEGELGERVAPNEGRILIVDDDPSISRSLQRILVADGYARPKTVRDAREAARLAHSWRPDLVILDVRMPGSDALLRQLREMSRADFLPIIVSSENREPEVRRRALKRGATEFLTKPLDATEALLRVRNALRTRFLHQHVVQQRDELERQARERASELADTRAEILHRLARTAEYRDDVTGRHAARVGLLASLIAAELGMNAEDRELIRLTAPLHDIGNIGIPEAILKKPGSLTPDEIDLMRRHTLIGARILEGGRHPILRMARDIAESHHERWDGDGYPHGLREDQIPIAARIVAVADTFDVLTHARPFRSAWTPRAALEEIVRCSGRHFDPDVAAAVKTIDDRAGPDAMSTLVDRIDPWGDGRVEPAPRRRERREVESHDS